MEIKKPLSKLEQAIISAHKEGQIIIYTLPRQVGRRLMYKRVLEELNTIDIEEVKPKELK